MTEVSSKKIYEGTVVSTKMDKVSVVLVERWIVHPMYKKRIKRSNKYFIRDEKNECHEGDKVSFTSCVPYSKKTSFKLDKILLKGEKNDTRAV